MKATWPSFNQIKELLKQEDRDSTLKQILQPDRPKDDVIILQFCGWAINLQDDGSWWFEATDGG